MVCFASPLQAGPYNETPESREFVREMSERYGFEAERVSAILANAQRRDSILEAISRPAEKTLEWHEYRRIFMRDERIEQGVSFLRKHQEAFERAEREYLSLIHI